MKKIVNKNITQTIGKRKTSIARCSAKIGTGIIYVNNQILNDYFKSENLSLKILEPLLISNLMGKFDFKIKVQGGGFNSQMSSVRQAIARAIVLMEKKQKDLKDLLVSYDKSLLVSDKRFKEMKKPNNSHARAKRQKSYR